MTGSVLRVVRVEPGRRVAHPLASGPGVAGERLLAAKQLWQPLSERARTALRVGYRRGLEEARAAGVPDGGAIEFPLIPADTHPHSVRALERRGLVADGRLTALGIEVTRLAMAAAKDRRPITTVRLPRPRL